MRPLLKSPSDDVQTICPICLEVVVDSTDEKEGQDAIYCNSWIHRQCAGLSQALYKLLEQSDDPFYYLHCHLITQQSQILKLKSTVKSLSKEIMSLKSNINQPQKL